ncbi:Lrp/AsnC family transcriptional regulator [Streptomyces montanisoli]|uniref:Lrp/AsnC family transcriptional regulator n=1 Tax=Streptomyces montanisoli TaxID=2798581 RepID=A0A940MBY6_9ACTN|nr:Lrp/AsnC family transcriptional regulator [Streptomyces montanisoli]MBP0457205.1 Lrp/AsnC family transcriptional regulator [Streptomyces montanisoli]
MNHPLRVNQTDAKLLLALAEHPRATAVALADRAGLSRNSVQSRLTALDRTGAVRSFERRISPAALGCPLTAFVTTRVVQRLLDEVAAALSAVPEVLQVYGLSGESDLLVHVVAADAEDLYRIAGRILGNPGVERTHTALVMRRLVGYRVTPLLQRVADARTGTRERHA